MSPHPHVKWAERTDRLFITIEASNAAGVKADFQENSVVLNGTGKTASNVDNAAAFTVSINLKKAIDTSKCSFKVLGQTIQVLCTKAVAGAYWERLTQEPSRQTKAWLSSDWNLWKDEDEEKEGEKIDFGGYGDISNMMHGANATSLPHEKDSDDESDEREPADLADLEN